jgi:hypothetical protein
MSSAEPTPDTEERHLTAWHVFLIELLRYFIDLSRVEVRDFVKLGTLPLEADAILLHKKHPGTVPELQRLMREELDFLEPRLRELTVLEYKSPKDALSTQAVDQVRTYALLAKQRFKLKRDGQVAAMLLYSHAPRGLFKELKQDRLDFVQEEEGIRCCDGSLVIYAVDLVVLGQKRPKSPLNLVSARHEKFSQAPGLDPATLALVEKIQYLIRQGTIRGMAVDKLPGAAEISRDADEILRRLMQNSPPKMRLEGLGPKEVLDSLDQRQQEELLALLLARRDQHRR